MCGCTYERESASQMRTPSELCASLMRGSLIRVPRDPIGNEQISQINLRKTGLPNIWLLCSYTYYLNSSILKVISLL